MTTKITVLRDVVSCSLVNMYRSSEELLASIFKDERALKVDGTGSSKSTKPQRVNRRRYEST
jgi:hypothetical protein